MCVLDKHQSVRFVMRCLVCMLKLLQTFWLSVFAHWHEKPCSQSSMVGDRLLLACQWCQCFCLMEGLDMSCKYHFFIIFNQLHIQQEPVTYVSKLELCISLFHCLILVARAFLLAGWLFVIILFNWLADYFITLKCLVYLERLEMYLALFSRCNTNYP